MQQEPKPGYDAASGVDVAAGSRNASATVGAFPSVPLSFLDWVESKGYDPERCRLLAEALDAALDSALEELDDERSWVLRGLKAP